MQKTYNENSTQHIDAREFTRKRPSTYCGSTEYSTQLLKELFANSHDEHIIGHGNEIIITVDTEKNEYTCEDFAQGFIPGVERPDGETMLSECFAVINTSGKYDDSDDSIYGGSALGLNGIGLKLVCYLSSRSMITTSDGKGQRETLWYKDGLFQKREITKEKIGLEDLDALEKGICNLDAHIKNMQKYTKNILVCLNRFTTDTDLEIAYVKKHCQELGCKFQVSTSYVNGGKGAIEVAKEIVNLCNNQVDFKPLYSFDETIINKINIIAKEIYHAGNVIVSNEAKEKIELFTKNDFSNLPVCIAKNQYSLTDNPKILGSPKDFTMTVQDVRLASGAGFIIVLMGNITTMPGLAKEPAYLKMKISKNYKISGLF